MQPFRVLLIEQSPAPTGALDGPWYRYVVANDITTITGWRIGSEQEVREHAEACAEHMNRQPVARFMHTTSGPFAPRPPHSPDPDTPERTPRPTTRSAD